ncbi:MAG: aldo/keto reductase [Parachlamydiaceae bacterium]
MDYVNLGKSGLKVSRICLGCMSYGDPSKGVHSWVLNEADSRPFYKKALDAGINFFDTANMYSLGASEEGLGRAIHSMTRREEVVIATKVYFPMRQDPNSTGLSRKSIFFEIDQSLKRLNTDYIDLYQIHRLDLSTPMEEILDALHDVVKAGKARYIGVSSLYAWQLAKMLYLAEAKNLTRFISIQPHYNLLYREEEREMFPLCKEEGIGVIPWSPLARGRLARPYGTSTHRAEVDTFGKKLYAKTEVSDKAIILTVEQLAKKHHVSMSQISLAWVLSKPFITAPIIGATKPHHLDEALAALDIKLSDEEIKALEAPYFPREVAGIEIVR